MWGTARDQRLLDHLSNKFPALKDLETEGTLIIHEGPQLRDKNANEPIEPLPEVIGKRTIRVDALRQRGRLYSFPPEAFEVIDEKKAYVRLGRGSLPLLVCKPPHIILGAARRYAIYSDEFLVVPPRQIGIASDESRVRFLKALSLFLSSKFATYHQFLHSPQWGVQRVVATLRTLKQLPVSVAELDDNELSSWLDLHEALVKASPSGRKKRPESSMPLFGDEQGYVEDALGDDDADASALYAQLNEKVYESLGIDESDRYLIEDLVDVKMQLIDGKVSRALCVLRQKPRLNRTPPFFSVNWMPSSARMRGCITNALWCMTASPGWSKSS